MSETQMERLERIIKFMNSKHSDVIMVDKSEMCWLLDRAELAVRVPHIESVLIHNDGATDSYEALYESSVRAGRARMIAAGEMEESDFAPSSLEDAIRFTEMWMKDAMPANDCGQIPFGRALLETCLASMKAEVAKKGGS